MKIDRKQLISGKMESAQRKETTFRLDQQRAISLGLLETGAQTFFLLIAVQLFQADAFTKALLVTSGPLGLLSSPLAVWLVRQKKWTAARGGAFFSALGALGFAFAAAWNTEWAYVVGCMLGSIGTTCAIPLLTQIYQNNYPGAERGDLFSRTVVLRVISAGVFSWLGGTMLENGIENYRWLIGGMAVAAGCSSWFLQKMPSEVLQNVESAHPFHALRHVKQDRVFRWLLLSWMLMGLGNLVMLPLRVDYIANPLFGIMKSPEQVAFLTGVIPSVTTLLTTRMWGRLFDRLNFFVLRICLNFGFILGIGFFFIMANEAGFLIGSFCFGLANAGGNVAWSLWVTKVARPGDVAEYMSVHTFTTGLRGVLSPFLGFYLASHYSISAVAWGAMGLIVLGSTLLVPEVNDAIKKPR